MQPAHSLIDHQLEMKAKQLAPKPKRKYTFRRRRRKARKKPKLTREVRHAMQRAHTTRRENEVVDLLLRGYENRDIAKELGMALRTVKNHFNSLFKKNGITGKGIRRVKLAVMMYKRQLCQEESIKECTVSTLLPIDSAKSSSLSMKA